MSQDNIHSVNNRYFITCGEAVCKKFRGFPYPHIPPTLVLLSHLSAHPSPPPFPTPPLPLSPPFPLCHPSLTSTHLRMCSLVVHLRQSPGISILWEVDGVHIGICLLLELYSNGHQLLIRVDTQQTHWPIGVAAFTRLQALHDFHVADIDVSSLDTIPQKSTSHYKDSLSARTIPGPSVPSIIKREVIHRGYLEPSHPLDPPLA